MVKLKRVNENQLDLFSWKPKGGNSVDTAYDGLSDTDDKDWFNVSYLYKKYGEYNRRFFKSSLPELPLYIKTYKHALGVCISLGSKSRNAINLKEICISKLKFNNRFSMEQVLVHEMCHAYQIHILCDNSLTRYSMDAKQGSGSQGHGPLFFKAADLVNNSPENKEGFKITQYNEDINTAHRIGGKSTSGYCYIKPTLEGLFVYTIADTPSNKENIDYLKHYEPEYMYSYKDAEAKSICTTHFGRTRGYIYPWQKIIESICNKIINGDLIPLVEDNKLEKKYIIYKDDVVSVSMVEPFGKEMKEVDMNKPYSIFQNRMSNECTILLKDRTNKETKRFLEGVKMGVFSGVEGIYNKNESLSIQDASDIIEDAENTLEVKEISDEVEEIIIE